MPALPPRTPWAQSVTESTEQVLMFKIDITHPESHPSLTGIW